LVRAQLAGLDLRFVTLRRTTFFGERLVGEEEDAEALLLVDEERRRRRAHRQLGLAARRQHEAIVRQA
jgi:hypothetical protein